MSDRHGKVKSQHPLPPDNDPELAGKDTLERSDGVSVRVYGYLIDGRVVKAYRLDNGLGVRLCVINLGGIVNALYTPDRSARSANIVLGLNNLAEYQSN